MTKSGGARAPHWRTCLPFTDITKRSCSRKFVTKKLSLRSFMQKMAKQRFGDTISFKARPAAVEKRP